jgi:hypothetical protein
MVGLRAAARSTMPHQASSQMGTTTPTAATFVGNRVRLQRLTDAKFFSGWVTHLQADAAHVKVNDNPDLEPGQEFAAEAHGADSVARFRGRIEVISEGTAVLKLTSPIHFAAGTEQARYLLDGVTCILHGNGRQLAAEVTDFSVGGIGVRLSRSLYVGTDFDVEITDGKLSITLEGQVRHCRLDPEYPDRYRAGILLAPDGPEQAYTWDVFRSRLRTKVRKCA